MDDIYKIVDNRRIDDFKLKTFSGFKKTDVFSILIKSIEQNKLENVCNWITECIISGYTMQIFDKLILYSCKFININNPNLPTYLLNKSNIFYNQINRINIQKDKNIILILRNSQMIRNLFFDIACVLTISDKTKKLHKLPKINENNDFNYKNIQNKLKANMNIIPNYVLRFNDPDELKIIINELYFNLKNKNNGYNKSCYWVLWLIHWEKLHKKNKDNWNVAERDVQVKKNYRNDIIWIIWDTIKEEINSRLKINNNNNNQNINKQIISLFNLYILNYTIGKKIQRLPIIFNAIGLLTYDIDFNILIRKNSNLFIQTQCNVNKMFKSKKISEINDPFPKTTPIKKNNKKITPQKEITLDKLQLFNSIKI